MVGSFLLLWRKEKKQRRNRFLMVSFGGILLVDFSVPFLFFSSHLFFSHPCLLVWCWTFNYDRFERLHGVALYLRCAANSVVLLNTRRNVYKIELSANDKTKCPMLTRCLTVLVIFKLYFPQTKVHSVVHPLSTVGHELIRYMYMYVYDRKW